MRNRIWGEMYYRTGFKTETRLSFFNREWNITVKIQAYKEEDGISPSQEEMCQEFKQNEAALLQKATHALLETNPDAANIYEPRELLFQKNGTCALLMSDRNNPDNGIAIQLMPDIQILYQDEYL